MLALSDFFCGRMGSHYAWECIRQLLSSSREFHFSLSFVVGLPRHPHGSTSSCPNKIEKKITLLYTMRFLKTSTWRYWIKATCQVIQLLTVKKKVCIREENNLKPGWIGIQENEGWGIQINILLFSDFEQKGSCSKNVGENADFAWHRSKSFASHWSIKVEAGRVKSGPLLPDSVCPCK